jgi:predicted RNA-binding Zn ribbon-like protein
VTKVAERLQSAFPAMAIESGHVWGPLDLVGGLLCLDFTNTAGGHTKIREVERIPSYGDVLNWGLAAGALQPTEARSLLFAAKADTKEAAQHVRELHEFREALHRMVAAIAHGREPEHADFHLVRATIAHTVATAEMRRGDGQFLWSVDADALGLDTIIARVALSAHHMLSQEKPSQLRQCERCTWLFIDRTKNQMRRFCRQDACGNKARAERFYARKRQD